MQVQIDEVREISTLVKESNFQIFPVKYASTNVVDFTAAIIE